MKKPESSTSPKSESSADATGLMNPLEISEGERSPAPVDPLANLNLTATSIFRELITKDPSLDQAWKAAAGSLTDSGVPTNVEALKKLMEGTTNGTSEDTPR